MRRRKAERRWRSSGLSVNKEIYDSTKKAVTIVHNAKCAYYSAKIVESSNTKQLFHITDKLMARHSRTPMPTKNLNELSELFSSFFSNKVKQIRNHLDKPLSEVNQDSPYAHDNQFSGCPLNSFTPISEKSLRKIILQCAPKTCELDAIPTSLFFECLDAILHTMTIVVNHSLLTGEFPLIFKTAIVKPLLKKTSLDSEDLKNYRSISNFLLCQKCLKKLCYLKYCNT